MLTDSCQRHHSVLLHWQANYFVKSKDVNPDTKSNKIYELFTRLLDDVNDESEGSFNLRPQKANCWSKSELGLVPNPKDESILQLNSKDLYFIHHRPLDLSQHRPIVLML